MSSRTRPITFLTDYGLVDEFVGVCHAVIQARAPGATIVDLTHGIARHDVRSGALVLRRALPYCPPGVHLAVIDPGVGSDRKGIALRTSEEDRILVGPDNGLLTLAASRFGGIEEAVDISRSAHRLLPTSATFHGRDIFAPVAAALAAGAELAEAGDPIDPDEVLRLDMPMAFVDVDAIVAHAISFDRYGNVALDVEHEEATGAGLRLGERLVVNETPARYATTFADVDDGEMLVYEDAYKTLAIAVNRGSAKDVLGIELDDELQIRRV